MSGLTAELAAFTCDPRFPELPARAVEIVQSGFADTIATMLAGRDEPVVRIAQQFVGLRQSSAAEASLLLGPRKAASADAALVNGAAGHALDFDDVALGGHPSTVLVPAILAEGERLDASGADALRAYLVGYEVWAELFSREQDPYHLEGMAPDGGARHRRRGGRGGAPEPAVRRALPPRDRAGRQHGLRTGGELRHHDQAAARRARRGRGHRRGAPGRRRAHGGPGCDRAPRRLPRGALAQWPGRPAIARDGSGQEIAHSRLRACPSRNIPPATPRTG